MSAIDNFFGDMHDDERRSYLRVGPLKDVLRLPRVLDALILSLRVPCKSRTVRGLSDEEKFAAIQREIEHLCSTPFSPFCGVRHAEALAAVLLASDLPGSLVEELTRPVRLEHDLLDPVAAWLVGKGLSAHDEVRVGNNRVDVVGHRPTGVFRGEEVVAVELKNSLTQLRRGMDQLATYAQYAHEIWLACTPELASQYLHAHGRASSVDRWDSKILDKKLQTIGCGLLLVEGDRVYEHLAPARRDVAAGKLAEIGANMRGRELRRAGAAAQPFERELSFLAKLFQG